MKNRLPDHPQIHVPIRLRCNPEITYTHHMRLHTIISVWEKRCFSKSEQQLPESMVPIDLVWTGSVLHQTTMLWWVGI